MCIQVLCELEAILRVCTVSIMTAVTRIGQALLHLEKNQLQ